MVVFKWPHTYASDLNLRKLLGIPETSVLESKRKFHFKVRPSGEKGSLIVIKENGKIKMKEVFKDYGTLWKVELEPAKVNFLDLIGYHAPDSDWLLPITNYYLL